MCTSLQVKSTRRLGKVGLTPFAADAIGSFTRHVGSDLLGLLHYVNGWHVVNVVGVWISRGIFYRIGDAAVASPTHKPEMSRTRVQTYRKCRDCACPKMHDNDKSVP